MWGQEEWRWGCDSPSFWKSPSSSPITMVYDTERTLEICTTALLLRNCPTIWTQNGGLTYYNKGSLRAPDLRGHWRRAKENWPSCLHHDVVGHIPQPWLGVSVIPESEQGGFPSSSSLSSSCQCRPFGPLISNRMRVVVVANFGSGSLSRIIWLVGRAASLNPLGLLWMSEVSENPRDVFQILMARQEPTWGWEGSGWWLLRCKCQGDSRNSPCGLIVTAKF